MSSTQASTQASPHEVVRPQKAEEAFRTACSPKGLEIDSCGRRVRFPAQDGLMPGMTPSSILLRVENCSCLHVLFVWEL